MSTITDSLEKAGFEPSVAQIYTILAESGELSVGQIVEKSKLSRAGAYDALNLLLAQAYIEYRKKGRNAFYKAVHPDKLYGLVEEKKRETTQLEDEVKGAIKALTGAFNLTQNKPGVRFFEGKDGFKEALYDSLTSSEPIYAYVDLEAVKKYVDDINKPYAAERIKRGVMKKLLVLDTPVSREYLQAQGPGSTEYKFLPKQLGQFFTGVEIYDGKVAYFTLREDKIFAVMIQDKDIYQFHRAMFEMQWNSVPTKNPPLVGEDTGGVSQSLKTPTQPPPFG
jgi:sugar-specific transcriptional regulator TrmB